MIEVSGAGVNWRAVVRFAAIVALVAFVIYFMTLIPKTIEVFLIATLIAYGLNPVVRRLSTRMPRAAAIIVVYLALIIAGAVLFLILVPATLAQFQKLFENSPVYVESARSLLVSGEAWLKAHLGPLFASGQISQIEATAIGRLSSGFETALGSASSILVGVANGIIIATFGVILSYFFLANSDAIRNSFFSLFPEPAQPKARLFTREVGRVVGGFIFGQVVLCAITFVLTYVALLIFRSQYALLLAVIAGLCYAIPYLGVLIAGLIGLLLGALTSWKTGLLILFVIFLTSKVADFLVPKVMGDSVGVSPMAIIFAIFAGGELFGLWGVILAIPAAALFKVMWMLWLHPWLTGRPYAEPATSSVQVPAATRPSEVRPQPAQ